MEESMPKQGTTELLLYKKLRQLHEAGLSESVDLFVTMCQSKLSQNHMYHKFLALQAEALHEMKQYEKAELVCKKALQFNKCSLRNLRSKTEHKNDEDDLPCSSETNMEERFKNSKNEDNSSSLMLGSHFYFKLAQIQIARQNYSAAMQSLLTIPAESRSLNVQVMILQVMSKQNSGLLTNGGVSRSEALSDLLEFLKLWPFAFSLITSYLREIAPIGSELWKELTITVEKALNDLKLNSVYTDWVVNWVKLLAMDFMIPSPRYLTQLQEVTTGIQTSLGVTPAPLLVAIATCQYHSGQYEHARANFTEARRKDPFILTGMTKYCHLLFMVKNTHMLDVVATKLMSIAPESVEALIALAYYCLAVVHTTHPESLSNNTIQKVSRVLYIAHKALLADSRCMEALLLKARALWTKEINRPNEALDHYREAQKWRPWCFEAYADHVELLLSGIIQKNQADGAGGMAHKEAIQNPALVSAFQAIKKCGKNARTLTLLAMAFVNEQMASKDKASVTIEKALEMDPKYTPAILLKADLILSESKTTSGGVSGNSNATSENAAVAWLKSKLDTYPESAIAIHEKLAAIWAGLDQKDEELVHKNIVMSLSRLPHDGSDISGSGFGSLTSRIEDDFSALDSVGPGYSNFAMDMETTSGLSGRGTGGGNGWHATLTVGAAAANDSDISFD